MPDVTHDEAMVVLERAWVYPSGRGHYWFATLVRYPDLREYIKNATAEYRLKKG